MSFSAPSARRATLFTSLLAAAALALAPGDAAAAPSTLTVQGVLSATSGDAVEGDYTLLLSLYDERHAPTPFWEESHTLTVSDGLFDATLGANVGNPLTVGDFAGNDEVWLGVSVLDGQGVPQDGEAELPRRRLSAIGYAFAAGYAESAGAAEHATTADSADAADTATTAQSAQSLACEGCVSLDHLGFDAVTQAALQAALAALDIPSSVAGFSGGTITGDVTVQGAVTADSYVLADGTAVCLDTGNCGQTLASLSCTAPNDVAVFDHDAGSWKCGTGSSSGGVNATDLSCSGCVSAGELDFEPVTQGDLDDALDGVDTALEGYATAADLEGYAEASDLEDYALATDLADYALATDLADYAKSADLEDYAKSADLEDYALTSDLDGYATVIWVGQTLESYLTATAIATAIDEALEDYATLEALEDYVTGDDLATTLADYALASDLPTSIDGLGGGEIEGSVHATEQLSATTIRQNGQVVCDQSGNCGQTLAGLDCDSSQTIRYDGTTERWTCVTDAGGGGGPGAGLDCTGDYNVLQWDGEQWDCRDLRKTGLSAGEANGWEIVDDWGDAWDAIERPPTTWEEALDTCVAEGGRLPTVTEIWRNRASSGGTGNFADTTATQYLWAYNFDYAQSHRDRVRVSDGNRTRTNATNNSNFRCIWPTHHSDAFDGSHCFGPPGEECAEKDLVWHVDRYSRPPMDAASAAWECRLHNASLMTMRDWQEIIQWQGFDHHVEDQWHWISDYAYYANSSPYHIHPSVQSNAGHHLHWTFGRDSGETRATVRWASSDTYFRCIGKRSSSIGVLPTPQCVDGDCFTVTRRNGVIVADNQDREAATQQDAEASCRALGGRLPLAGEFLDLIQSGWENGSDAWLWSNDVDYVYNGNYRYAIFRWSGTQGPDADMSDGTVNQSIHGSARAYRCVWPERFEEAMTQCDAHQNQTWTGTAYACEDAVEGDVSAEDSWPPGSPAFGDAWGNKWDFFQRNSTMNFETAKATCEDLGGRLPTATELWRVRLTQDVVDGNLGQSTDTSYLWTLNPSSHTGYRIVMRLSDGNTTHAQASNAGTERNVRCIWPTTKGDAFGGRSCYGVPSDEDGGCFVASEAGMRMDAYDRAPVRAASAAWECRFYGGRLPNVREYQAMIRSGLPNASEQWLRAADAAYWYSGNYGTSSVRVADGQAGAWAWSISHGELSNYRTATVTRDDSTQRFRCVYSNWLN